MSLAVFHKAKVNFIHFFPQQCWDENDQISHDYSNLYQEKTLESNFDEAHLLAQKYPDRIYFLRYEDLCLMPEKHVVSLFRFLGRSITRPIKKYTVLHMSTKDLDPHGTRRKAKVQALQWTKEMPISDIHRVESQCQGFMKKAGYIGFHHSSEWTDEYQFLAPDSTVWNYTESNQHWFLD